MNNSSSVLVIAASSDEVDKGRAISKALGFPPQELSPYIVEGTPADAASHVHSQAINPRYIVAFIGDRGAEILPELDTLAEQCEPGTAVVVIGSTNDINFYRSIKERGVAEYFNYPAPIDEVCNALLRASTPDLKGAGRVISCLGGASGDGSSMVALNLAYLMATTYEKKAVIVDLDYQFGMLARQLELKPNYGVEEIFEHPERGVDSTLTERMAVSYKPGLDVITAPHSLRFMPNISADIMRDFIGNLASRYQFVILDLPHRWNHWVSATIAVSDHILIVAQLLLKSITNTSRWIGAWTELGFNTKPTSIVINRSGSRYKEALHPKDFERILGRSIDFYLPNDIKTVCQAENRGIPVSAAGQSQLSNNIDKIAKYFVEN